MNLSHPIPVSINRFPWLLAAIALLSLSILLVNMSSRPLFGFTEPPGARSSAIPTFQQGYPPQVVPVPTPSQSRWTPMQAPKLSATPIPADTYYFPKPLPVATPPVRK
jgi:hypothetical protein